MRDTVAGAAETSRVGERFRCADAFSGTVTHSLPHHMWHSTTPLESLRVNCHRVTEGGSRSDGDNTTALLACDGHACPSALVQSSTGNSAHIQLLPPPLLALIAAHLEIASLLRLQRCSAAQHHLRVNDAYMTVAWRWAELNLSSNKSLAEWTLPYEQLIRDKHRLLIPASLWQAARSARVGTGVVAHVPKQRRLSVLLVP